MSAFAVFLAILCVWHICRLWRWENVDATMALEDRTWTYTGQKLPIVFKLRDGTEITSFLTLNGRSGIPKRGSTISIIYDPSSPKDVHRAWTPLAFVGLIGVLLFVAVAPWFS